MDNKNAPAKDLNISYDNGNLLLGWIVPSYPPYSWLIKTDINGGFLWEKLIGGVNDSYVAIKKIVQNKNGDIFLCGGITVDDDSNPLVIKINACGYKEWCREISTTSNNDFFLDIIDTEDNGCAVLIDRAFTPLSTYQTGIVRFSAIGDLLWQQYYQSEDSRMDFVHLSDLIMAPDRGFLLTGYCYYLDPDNPNLYWLHPYYIKVDSLGNFEWETVVHKETGDIGGDAFMSLFNPSETCYYSCISHYYHSDTLNTTRPAVVKLDLLGNVKSVYDLVQGNYDLGKIMTFDFLNDSLLVGSASWRNEEDDPQSRVIIFDTLGHITNSTTIVDDYFLGLTKVAFDDKILIFKSNLEANDLDPTLYKLTENLEQDTFYTTPFVYDSLCSYQIVSDTIVPDDCGVIVGVEEHGGEEEKGGQGEEGKMGRLEVWPNPAGGIVDCRWSMVDFRGDFSLRIYDLYGREMINISVPENEREIQFDVGNLSPGIYFVILTDSQIVKGSAKFMVVR